jgi:hypothetical protein
MTKKERREKIATSILVGIATQVECSKWKVSQGLTKNVTDQDYIDKAVELAEMLISKLDELNNSEDKENDGPLQSN